MRISWKLPVFVTLVALLSIAGASVASFMETASVVRGQAVAKLEAVANGRQSETQLYLKSLVTNLHALAGTPTTGEALGKFRRDWRYLGENPKATLTQRYITDNPNPDGKKALLDTARVDTYDSNHALYHPLLRASLQRLNYADVFLIDGKGTILYSVQKNSEYAANLADPALKDGALGAVFRKMAEVEDRDAFAMSDFVAYGAGKQPMLFMATPLFQGDVKVGVLAVAVDAQGLNAIFNNRVGLGETGETRLLNADARFITASPVSPGGAVLEEKLDQPVIRAALDGKAQTGAVIGAQGTRLAAVMPLTFAGNQWAIAALMQESEALNALSHLRNVILIITACMVVAAIAAAVFFSRTITNPIRDLVSAMTGLAGGDTSVELKGEGRRDELGDMARSVAVFRDAAIEKMALQSAADRDRQTAEQERQLREATRTQETARLQQTVEILGEGLRRLASGDLTASIDQPFMEGLDRLRLDFNQSIRNLSEIMQRVAGSTGSISTTANEMMSATDDLSRRSEQQAAAIEETSAVITQIMEAIQVSAERAASARQMVADAKLSTERSGEIVSTAVEAMQRIEQASLEISKIINVIDEIAFQTNLLALNAGVEAARAGEAGKGFAVVAQEVRELAQRSANAAREIKALISKSSDAVKSGVGLVENTGEALGGIADQVARINAQIASIADAAGEQQESVREISSAIRQMETTTQQNSQMAEKTNADMSKLTRDAQDLSGLISGFRLDERAPVSSFKPSQPIAPEHRPLPVSVPPRPVAAKVKPADTKSRSAPSPAKALMSKLSSSFSSASATATSKDADWEEF